MKDVVRRRADWSDVRVFWAVAELGSFGAAARALKLGLTTVTRAVDRLEGQLNAKLLTRGPQGVGLTEAGKLAHDRALSMERFAEQLEMEVADCEKLPEGRVRLAAPDGVAGMFLALPVIAILKIVFDRIESLKPWGMVLGDEETPRGRKINPAKKEVLDAESKK